MSDQPKCWDCKFYQYPECRRRAPAVIERRTMFGTEQETVFPRMSGFDWCGDFERKEDSNGRKD